MRKFAIFSTRRSIRKRAYFFTRTGTLGPSTRDVGRSSRFYKLNFYNALLDFESTPIELGSGSDLAFHALTLKQILQLAQLLDAKLGEGYIRKYDYMQYLADSTGLNRSLIQYFIAYKLKVILNSKKTTSLINSSGNLSTFCVYFRELNKAPSTLTEH